MMHHKPVSDESVPRRINHLVNAFPFRAARTDPSDTGLPTTRSPSEDCLPPDALPSKDNFLEAPRPLHPATISSLSLSQLIRFPSTCARAAIIAATECANPAST